TEALEGVHLKSLIHGHLELTAPCALHVDNGRCGFYFVTRGTCWLEVSDDEPLPLARGDLVLLTRAQPTSCGTAGRRGRRPRGKPSGAAHGRAASPGASASAAAR